MASRVRKYIRVRREGGRLRWSQDGKRHSARFFDVPNEIHKLEARLNAVKLSAAEKIIDVDSVRIFRRGSGLQLSWYENGKRRFFSLGSGATQAFAESMQKIKAGELRGIALVEDEKWFT